MGGGREDTRAVREANVWAVSRGTGKALLSGSVKLSSESVELTAVGEDGVIKGGGEESLEARGGGMGRARGEGRGKGMEACSSRSR